MFREGVVIFSFTRMFELLVLGLCDPSFFVDILVLIFEGLLTLMALFLVLSCTNDDEN